MLTVGLACAMGMTAASLAIPYLIGTGVDRVRGDGIEAGALAGALWPLAAGVLGLALARYLFTFGRRYLTNNLGHIVEYRMRRSLFGRMLDLPHRFYDGASTGELVSRATNDLRVIRFFVARGMFQLFTSLLTLLIVSVLLFYENATLATLVLSPMPVLAFAAWRFASKVHPIFRSVQEKLADVTTQVQENVSGIRVVKSFAREPFETGRFGERAEGVMNETLAARSLRAFYIPGMSFLPSTSIALLVLFGGRAVVSGDLSLGTFVAFQLYLMQLVSPMQTFGMVVDQGQRALASCERVFEILDTEPDLASPANPTSLPEGPLGVEFCGVSFSHGPNEILREVSLRVEPGETVAVVGATGAGKSTLLSLIPRFYDPASGSARVGGADVRGPDLEELRRSVGVVPQETFLFSDTVRNNIAYGNEGAAQADIERAAKAAGIHGQVSGFPEGYDTHVGEWGITLSGGQKQRVAIARALVKSPRVLILDDATSSVDAETEREIQASLQGTLGGKMTTFIVAHRLSAILLADRVVVLDGGRVAGSGTHEELLAGGGLYAELYGSDERASA